MCKIVVLANNSSGLYDFRKELLQKLHQDNNEVIAYTPFDLKVDELRALGIIVKKIDIDRRGINPIKDLKLFVRLLFTLNKERPDLVITYTIKPNVYGGIACRLFHIPYAVNITGLGTAFQKKGVLRSIVMLLYRLGTVGAKVVFFENSENRTIFVRSKIVKKNKTVLLHGAGVNLDHFKLQPYPTKQSPVQFLFIGRVMQEKGIDELFTAMRKLKKDGKDCFLNVLGGYEEDYKDIIQKYENEGWLHYYGYQQDVRPYILQSHCFVLPSWHEGMANTNLECAASGRPIITSNIPGCKEAVGENVSGFLCERKNAESLYKAMCHFIDISAEERKQLGINGRKRMEKYFDKNMVVEKTILNLR